jgi:AcrR family transcriptional regulator
MGAQGSRARNRLSTPSERALSACVAVALRTGGRGLSVHDYARKTGVSARMLIHYFGSKAGLDAAVIRAVDDDLRQQAENLGQSLGGLEAIDELVRGFRSPQSRPVRKLFRTLLAKALQDDRLAIMALIEERARWTALFEKSLKSRSEASNTVVLLLGAAMDAILDDMSSQR